LGTVDKNSETAGGNLISEGLGNLQADWDVIPKSFGASAKKALIDKAMAVPHTNGSLEGWAAVWAGKTVMAAHTAFNGFSFTGTGAQKWSFSSTTRKRSSEPRTS